MLTRIRQRYCHRCCYLFKLVQCFLVTVDIIIISSKYSPRKKGRKMKWKKAEIRHADQHILLGLVLFVFRLFLILIFFFCFLLRPLDWQLSTSSSEENNLTLSGKVEWRIKHKEEKSITAKEKKKKKLIPRCHWFNTRWNFSQFMPR